MELIMLRHQVRSKAISCDAVNAFIVVVGKGGGGERGGLCLICSRFWVWGWLCVQAVPFMNTLNFQDIQSKTCAGLLIIFWGERPLDKKMWF
jgi:hypothetical protein